MPSRCVTHLITQITSTPSEAQKVKTERKPKCRTQQRLPQISHTATATAHTRVRRTHLASAELGGPIVGKTPVRCPCNAFGHATVYKHQLFNCVRTITHDGRRAACIRDHSTTYGGEFGLCYPSVSMLRLTSVCLPNMDCTHNPGGTHLSRFALAMVRLATVLDIQPPTTQEYAHCTSRL